MGNREGRELPELELRPRVKQQSSSIDSTRHLPGLEGGGDRIWVGLSWGLGSDVVLAVDM